MCDLGLRVVVLYFVCCVWYVWYGFLGGVLGELSTRQYYDRVNVQILVLNTGGKTTLSLDAANASTKVLL